MRVPVVLHAISSFDQDILETSATPVLKGLSRCISSSGPLRSEIIVSPDFWSILQRLHTNKSSAPLVFELLQKIVESTPPAISADNYESAVSLANDFASAGSIGAAQERKRDAQIRKSRGAKSERPPYVDSFTFLHSRGLMSSGRIKPFKEALRLSELFNKRPYGFLL
jgi:brefeldin A-resistance guanine nucleotide exchange factor 1